MAAGTTSLPKLAYSGLPEPIRERVLAAELGCGYSRKAIEEGASAYALDANADFRTDFVHFPAEGINEHLGFIKGICAGNNAPFLMWVSNSKGDYDEMTLWEDNLILARGPHDVMFTASCGASLAAPDLSLAVLDRDKPSLTAFGRCFHSPEAAIQAASEMGYRQVDFRRTK
jgi:hypothetical protein